MVNPVSPEQVVELKKKQIPDGVIEAFNEIIAKNWNGHSSTVLQDEVVEAIIEKVPRATRRKVFDNHWLDVEDIFRSEGWKVEYDKPGYNETYRASFKFTK